MSQKRISKTYLISASISSSITLINAISTIILRFAITNFLTFQLNWIKQWWKYIDLKHHSWVALLMIKSLYSLFAVLIHLFVTKFTIGKNFIKNWVYVVFHDYMITLIWYWRPPSLSELAQIVFNMGLTYLGSEISI